MALRAALISIALACAAACSSSGGGGGGGSVTTPPESPSPPPESQSPPSPLPPPPPGEGIFNPTILNHTIGLVAITVTGDATVATDAAGNVTLDSISFTAPGSGSVRLFYENPPQLSELVIDAAQPNSNASFRRSMPGHSIVCGNASCVADNPVASAVIIDPFHAATNWNYQTFGVWISNSPTALFGAFSAGAPTPASTVLQMTGSAVFRGLTAGIYVDGTGTPFATASTMTANVDFSTRNIGFSTSDMGLVNINNGAESTRSDLRISGTLTFPSGHSFSGNITTAQPNPSDRLTGMASGRFYGPAAHEIGGVYTLSRSGTPESMIGGFGGKR
jgi:hypothetical protein